MIRLAASASARQVSLLTMRTAGAYFTLVLSVAAVPDAAADTVVLAGGRLRLAGEASASLAPKDPGYFNETDYQDNVLRLARLSLSASLRANDNVELLGELRTDNFSPPRLYALYLRLHPWPQRALDAQVGLIPPVFGSFARRAYGNDNPLIGYPLAYQYTTTIRSDAAAASVDDILWVRGYGVYVWYPVGSTAYGPGLPLIDGVRWDTGVQIRVGSQPVQLTAALTQGSLSHPRVRDDNDGKQVSLRGVWQPAAGLLIGVSAARGEYLDRELRDQLMLGSADAGSYHQRALGADVECSRGHWLVRLEGVWSEWDAAILDPPTETPELRAMAISMEGRYKVAPGVYLAARADRLGFNRIEGSAGAASWDAPVSRVEAGVGWQVTRHVVLKGVYQYNWRDGGPARTQGMAAMQALLWF